MSNKLYSAYRMLSRLYEKEASYSLSLHMPDYILRSIVEQINVMLPDEFITNTTPTVSIWRPFASEKEESGEVLSSLFGIEPFTVKIELAPMVSYEENCVLYFPVISKEAKGLELSLSRVFDPIEAQYTYERSNLRCIFAILDRNIGVKIVDQVRSSTEEWLCNTLDLSRNGTVIKSLRLGPQPIRYGGVT